MVGKDIELHKLSIFSVIDKKLLIHLLQHLITRGTFPIQVDTEICEQLFSWLSKYARITQHMNKHPFTYFICVMSITAIFNFICEML